MVRCTISRGEEKGRRGKMGRRGKEKELQIEAETGAQAEERVPCPVQPILAYGGEKSASVTCFVLAEGTHQTEWRGGATTVRGVGRGWGPCELGHRLPSLYWTSEARAACS